MGDVPESVPVTEETRDHLRQQANQLGEPEVLRLIDLLAVAVEDARQGADPRLPLELALIKVTRPAADLTRESLAFRVERLENRSSPAPRPEPETARGTALPAPAETEQEPGLELGQLQHQWRQAVVPAVTERSIPMGTVLREARPVELSGNRLVVEFPASAAFHRSVAEDPKNTALLAEALFEVTGRRLALAFAVGEPEPAGDRDESYSEPAGEEAFLSLLRDEFDAREIGDE